MSTLVLATRNAHKVGELRAILGGHLPGVEVVGVDAFDSDPDRAVGDVVESGVTFAENALLKARAVAAGTGLPAVADDSGLCVDVLGGAPGIFSARWCGRHGDDEANLRLLLAQLADVPAPHRGAHFACAAALVLPDGTEHVELGSLPGVLVAQPSGGGGFGYDPILVPDAERAPGGRGRTCAQLSAEEKNAISHRGAAFRAIAPAIARALG
ncbi:XTP/dITP diphosphohydrolase [Kineococcus xinjiangensis]|uniref:dITP/XTP pyrophosphatase n=1 Tax=Kineococcus xinjiangensis TaxID=512762 RepID=A0A2S6ICP3_9ACTN|nr:non-canonical purine NTP pyrophosphatase [Kineococcus xinjiangensis]PPK91994.1 XTP/dITP diphosphohydrolase [Kineococcus xinjiangensis]